MKHLFIIGLFLVSGIGFSQKQIAVRSKVSENKIELRWTPVTSELFKKAMQHGFLIERKEIVNSVGNDFWNSGIDFSTSIYPVAKDDSVWRTSFRKYEETGIVYSFIYPEKSRNKTEEENLFGLALLSCDLNPDLAKITGLYFKDSTIDQKRKYAYRISVKGENISEIISVNAAEKDVYPSLAEWEVKKGNLSGDLSWNFKKYQLFYCCYLVERSEDGILFTNCMKRPFVPMKSQYEKEKEITFFTDTGLVENKTYWYRISGIDHFGGNGPYSQVLQMKASAFFEGEILIDTLYESGLNEAILDWRFTSEKDKKRITSVKILRSKTADGEYKMMAEPELNANSIRLNLNERENFIKVQIWNNDFKLESWPEMILMPDRVPPMVPDSLIGKIDTNGIVTLNWKKNTETDLKGYRIFRSNAMHEEFAEVSKNFISDTKFTDTIVLLTLTEEIFYTVNAVDVNYNNSQQSIPFKIQKPDIINPEVSPVCRVEARKTGNYVQWIKSKSKDVSEIIIERSIDDKKFEKIFFIKANDSTAFFTDSVLSRGEGYYYRTRTVDDANNFSVSESVYLKNTIPETKTNQLVKVTVDRTRKFIQLSWEPLKESVYSYTVYRAKKGENLRSLKTFSGAITTITDRNLAISNEYIYAVKAMLTDGTEIMLAKEVLVVY
jgi:hypothetical protein